jgi:hypothetical protein
VRGHLPRPVNLHPVLRIRQRFPDDPFDGRPTMLVLARILLDHSRQAGTTETRVSRS